MASSWLLLLGSTGENDKNHALLHVKSLPACSVHFSVFHYPYPAYSPFCISPFIAESTKNRNHHYSLIKITTALQPSLTNRASKSILRAVHTE